MPSVRSSARRSELLRTRSAVPPSETFDSSQEPGREHRPELARVLGQQRRCALRAPPACSSESGCPRRAPSRTSPATTPWASRKGTPEPHEQVGHVGRGDQLVGGGLAPCARGRSAAPASIPRGRRERQLERVDRVEQVLLVLLQVLVVGQRQRVDHPMQGRQVGDHAGRLRAQQLGRVRVLLLGHDRGARAPRVGQLAEAELRARPQHELGAEARQVGRAGRGGARGSRGRSRGPETASIEFGDDLAEAELARRPAGGRCRS